MSNLIQLAANIAQVKHGNQKYGSRPYMYHLRQVVEIVHSFEHDFGEEVSILGYLHDAFEDTDLRLETVADLFGERVARCLDLVTDPKVESRAARKELVNRKLGLVSGDGDECIALIVKAADRLANVRHSVKEHNHAKIYMYSEEQAEFGKAVYRYNYTDVLVNEITELLSR